MGWAVAQQNYQGRGHIGYRCPGKLNGEKPLIKGDEKIGYAYGKGKKIDPHKNITPDNCDGQFYVSTLPGCYLAFDQIPVYQM